MRLIDADEAIRSIKEDGFMWVYDVVDIEEFLAEIPAIEAEPVKHARWLQPKSGECFCSECKTLGSPQRKRCPVCEAKMTTE